MDTPPYRLNADEFLDMKNYTEWGGYAKKIDKGYGTFINVDRFDFTTLSFGIKQDYNSMPHHMDFWMNTMPRKILGYKTLLDLFVEEMNNLGLSNFYGELVQFDIAI